MQALTLSPSAVTFLHANKRRPLSDLDDSTGSGMSLMEHEDIHPHPHPHPLPEAAGHRTMFAAHPSFKRNRTSSCSTSSSSMMMMTMPLNNNNNNNNNNSVHNSENVIPQFTSRVTSALSSLAGDHKGEPNSGKMAAASSSRCSNSSNSGSTAAGDAAMLKRTRINDNEMQTEGASPPQIDNNNNPLANLQRQMESMHRFHESQLASLRAQHQVDVDRREQESAACSKIFKQLVDQSTRLEQSNRDILEENKVLKRAVSIQDNKLRELTQQHGQLQGFYLPQAAERIAQLEKENEELRSELRRLVEFLTQSQSPSKSNSPYQSGFGGFFPPQPPPDVY